MPAKEERLLFFLHSLASLTKLQLELKFVAIPLCFSCKSFLVTVVMVRQPGLNLK